MADDVADRDANRPVWQDHRVVPVAADAREALARPVLRGELDARDCREAIRQQVALKQLDEASLTVVAAGVLDRDRSALCT